MTDSSRTVATADPQTRDHAPLLERAFDRLPEESSYRIRTIEGTIPEWVRGSYYLNGPARFHRGELRYRHWLDGDGMVCALHFDEDGVEFVSRWVGSAKRQAEEEAGRALYRAFGTAFPGDQLKHGIGLESPVNVSVYPFAGKLLAFGEQGLPYELDPRTLETRDVHTFGRRLNPISPFAAHPHFDPETGEMVNFGVSFSAHQPCVHFYRFNAAGELQLRRRLPLDAPASVHDFGLSPHYGIFYLGPYVLDMERMAQPDTTLMEALTWKPEQGTRLLIVDRRDGEPVAKIPLGAGYCLHLVDCFEEDGLLSVEILELDRPIYDQYWLPDLFTEVRSVQPVRYTVDPAAGRLVRRMGLEEHRLCDFPVVDPRRFGQGDPWFWCLGISASDRPGRKFFDQVLRADWRENGYGDCYQAPAGHFLGGEPVFLPDGPEATEPRRGAVICQELDPQTRTGAFLLFDAFDLAAGPMARLELESPVHLGFHTAYQPAWERDA
jgi:all-trans-8'-apo-beta-carotenal 15,15'-oxygenase